MFLLTFNVVCLCGFFIYSLATCLFFLYWYTIFFLSRLGIFCIYITIDASYIYRYQRRYLKPSPINREVLKFIIWFQSVMVNDYTYDSLSYLDNFETAITFNTENNCLMKMVLQICIQANTVLFNKRYRIPKGQSKMNNLEKLATSGIQDEEKQNKNITQYVLDTTMRK